MKERGFQGEYARVQIQSARESMKVMRASFLSYLSIFEKAVAIKKFPFEKDLRATGTLLGSFCCRLCIRLGYVISR